ncbi:MAG: HAMP domain-containing histidine kinase [Emcibacteraceae bacterium]|nr:HAMP domain-containing histidine kinase [Emcibacteraceae bacterium]
MIELEGYSPQFREFAHKQNVKIHKIFTPVLIFICILLWIDNTETIKPINPDILLTYSNVAAAFTFLFLAHLSMHLLHDYSKKLQTITLWTGIFKIFVFIFCLGFLDLKDGNGLMAPALGFVTLAVLFSGRIPVIICLFLTSGILFYFIASQIDGINIVPYRAPIISIVVLSISIFIIVEKQRRTVFNSQELLAKKIEELNNALDVKSIFVGHMSHELRTPLNAIIGFSDMILNDAYLPKTIKKVKEYNGYINSSGLHLLKIVNDILDHTKIESGEVSVIIEQLNLNLILQTSINELSAASIKKDLSVTLKMNSTPLMINSDKRLLKQIIFNLISNAQKFTSPGGLIEIYADMTDNNHVEIRVKDNGKGMDEEILTTVNDQSAPINTHFITHAEGTGLGLIIVRQLVQLLNGSIEFKSKPEIGTEIKISFPLQAQ